MIKLTIKKLPNRRVWKNCSTKKSQKLYYGTQSPVKLNTKEKIQFVTLDRPKQLNSLNLKMVKKMLLMYQHYDKDDDSKGIILEGAGKAFCAGGDIKSIYDSKDVYFFKKEYQLNLLINELSIPHIALLDGVTMGGGVGVSIHGSVRVATENTLFAMPEALIGFFCDVGGSYFLPRLEKNLGMFLGLTGHRLKGNELLKAGLATHFVPSSKIPELKDKLVETSCSNLDETINSIHNQEEELKNSKLSVDLSKVDKPFSKLSVEEIVQTLEKSGNEFSQNALRSLKRNSPTSLKVIHEQILRGKNKTLKECLDMELKIAKHMMTKKDFFEGVRALLVDKDKNPKWNPKTLEDVSRKEVLKYFE